MFLCVASVHAEPEPEAWGGIRNPIVGTNNKVQGNQNSVLGFGFDGRKKKSVDPEPVVEPEAAARDRFVFQGGFGGGR